MPQRQNDPPAPGDLWLSRPPYTFVTRVRAVAAARERTVIEHELLDDDGAVLNEVPETLDASWLRNFQPLVRRLG